MLANPHIGKNEGPTVVHAGKYYAVIRGRRVGVFQDSL